MSKLLSTKKLVNEMSVLAVIRASRPSFRNSHDKIAFVVHASFLAAGYFLNATGTPAFSHDALTSTSTDEVGTDQWNEYAYNYAFVYINPEKGLKKVLVKCLAENGKLIVDAWGGYGSSPFHLEIDVRNYVEESTETNYGSHFKNLRILLGSIYKVILVNFSDSLASSSSTEPPSSSSSSQPLSSSSTQPSTSSCERSRGADQDNVKKPGVKVFILKHHQPCCHFGYFSNNCAKSFEFIYECKFCNVIYDRILKSIPAVYPSVGSHLFSELSATYPHRNDFGYGRGRRIGQVYYPWFFGGIYGVFREQRVFGEGGCLNQNRRYGAALGFEPNQPSMLWWHWWRVWFPHTKTEVVLEMEEEEKWKLSSPSIAGGDDSI